MPQPKFKLRVASREGLVFEGEVESISSYNEEGKFDVLAQHANFISLIKRGLELRDDEGFKKIDFDNALLRVKKSLVEVYVGVEGMAPTQLTGSEIVSKQETVKNVS